jgi:hypothetical protein
MAASGLGEIDAGVFGSSAPSGPGADGKSQNWTGPLISSVKRSYSPYRWPLVEKTYFTSKRSVSA